MESIIVIPKKKSDTKFLVDLLKSLDKVKSVKIENIIPFVKISETSLAKDWNTPEDDRWDEKLK
jgi:hypothetical protein